MYIHTQIIYNYYTLFNTHIHKLYNYLYIHIQIIYNYYALFEHIYINVHHSLTVDVSVCDLLVTPFTVSRANAFTPLSKRSISHDFEMYFYRLQTGLTDAISS